MGYNKKLDTIDVPGKPDLSGWIIEDIWIDKYEDWEPHIQAIKHSNGDLSLRFCYYKKEADGTRGRFVHTPMFIYTWLINDLVQEAKKHDANIILALLQKFTT